MLQKKVHNVNSSQKYYLKLYKQIITFIYKLFELIKSILLFILIYFFYYFNYIKRKPELSMPYININILPARGTVHVLR